MYYETRKVNSKKEKFLFSIPFKDGNEIKYHFNKNIFSSNEEICSVLPNVSTNSINLVYYIKIIASLDNITNKKIKLKMFVDFISKDPKNNKKNNFEQNLNKISSKTKIIFSYIKYKYNNNKKF